LDHLAAAVHAAVRQEIRRTAVRIQAGARRRLHEHGTSDTGRLANSIAIAEEQGGLDARIGTNLVYARAIEFGFPPGYLQRTPAGARRRLRELWTSATGRLANSIASAEEPGGRDARIGTNLVYARAIEFGFPPGYLQRMPPVEAIQGWVRRKLGVRDREEARSI